MKIHPKNQIVFTLYMLPGTYVIPASEVFDNPNEWGNIVREWESIQKAIEENDARLKDALLSSGDWVGKAWTNEDICNRILENNKARKDATLALAKAINYDALLSKCSDDPYETVPYVHVFVDDATPLIPWGLRYQYLHPYRDSVELAGILARIHMRLDVNLSLCTGTNSMKSVQIGDDVVRIFG